MAQDLDLQLKINALVEGTKEVKELFSSLDKAGKVDLSKSSLSKSLTSLGNQFKSVGANLTAKLSLPLAGLAAASVAAAGKMQKLGVEFQTFAGSAEKAQETLEKVKEFTSVTPFSIEETSSAAKTLGNFGVGLDELIPKLKQLGELSAGTGANLNDLAQIYGKVKVEGKLTGETLAQFAERGIPVYKALAKELGVNQKSIKKLTSEGKVGLKDLDAAFLDLTLSGGAFAGQLLAQSNTIPGALSTLKDSFFLAFADIGEELNNTFDFSGILLSLAGFVNDFRKNFKDLGDGTKQFITVFAGIAAAVGPILLVVGQLLSTLGPLLPLFTSLASKVVLFVKSLTLMKGALISTGIGALVVALGLVVAKLVEARNETDSWANAFKLFSVKANLAVLKVRKFFLDFLIDINEKTGGSLTTIANTFQSLGGKLGLAELSKAILSAFLTPLALAIEVISRQINQIKGLFSDPVKFFQDLGNTEISFDAALSSITEFGTSVKARADGLADTLIEPIANLGQDIKIALETGSTAGVDAQIKQFERLEKRLQKTGQKVKSAFAGSNDTDDSGGGSGPAEQARVENPLDKLNKSLDGTLNQIRAKLETANSLFTGETLSSEIDKVSQSGINSLIALDTKFREILPNLTKEEDIAAVTGALDRIQERITGLGDGLVSQVPKIETFGDKLRDTVESGITNGFITAFDSVIDKTKSLGEAFSDMVNGIARDITRLALNSALQSAFAGGIGGNSTGGLLGRAQGGPIPAFNSGGRVQAFPNGLLQGPGTSTSDSIIARVSKGEFVQRGSAVRLFGEQFMSAVNSLQPSRAMSILESRFKKFNTGGIVGGTMALEKRLSNIKLPKFEQGGLVRTSTQQSGAANPAAMNVKVELQNNGTPQQATVASQRFDGKDLVVTVLLDDIRKNGQIAQGLQGVFGLNRNGR